MTRIQQCLSVLAGLSGALLALAAAAPAALASLPLPPGNPQVAIRTAATGGMPGWQIILIATGAALAAAVTAVILDRARTARRHMPHPAT